MAKNEKKFKKKRWICSQCEEEIEYNTRFYDEAKEVLKGWDDSAKNEWNDLNKLEKTKIRELLESKGLFPTILSADGRAHFCEVKSTREEIEALKLKVKHLTANFRGILHDIKEVKSNISDIKGQLSAIKKRVKDSSS